MSIFFGLLFARRFYCCPALYFSPEELGDIFSHKCTKIKKAAKLRLSFLASPAGFEPTAFRLGVDPIRHREVASNA